MRPEAERYLARATCLLPPGTRERVRRELHAHLYQAALDAQLGGLDEQDAWAEAIRAAGPAWRAALGLARVHTLARLARPLLLTCALGGAAYAVTAAAGSPAGAPPSHGAAHGAAQGATP